EVQVGRELDAVPKVGGEEPVDAVAAAAAGEQHEPGGDGDEERRDRPEREDDPRWNHEDQAKQDGDPPALQVVRDDQADWAFRVVEHRPIIGRRSAHPTGTGSVTSVPAAVTRDAVLRAADVIRGRVHRTPIFTASTLGDVWLKAELFQKTGSFKVRGVLNKLMSLTPEEKARGVIGISAGNHAQALAWGAAREGVDCLVV